MNPSECRVRRATVDDLSSLIGLWEGMRLSPSEMERRLTEFQVVEASDGSLLGTIAIEIIGRQGRLHSECFGDFSLADPLREKIWRRLQTVASNHGLTRLWIQESAPFWKQTGFQAPNAEGLAKLPADWTALPPNWQTLPLKAEEAFDAPVEKEFEQFRLMERARTERALARTKVLNQIATVVAIILAFIVLAGAAYIFAHRSRLPVR